MAKTKTTCDACGEPTPKSALKTVDKLVCRQTHSSPAEYESMAVCEPCLDRARYEDDNADYLRAVAGGWAD